MEVEGKKMIDKEKAKEIQKQISICLGEIKKLLEMTYEIKPYNKGFGSHYPIECERLLHTMNFIFQSEAHGININLNKKGEIKWM